MKRIALFVIISFLSICLTSCRLFYANSDSLACTVCARRSVPGMFDDDLKNGFSADAIETDDQGRILFKYRSENWLKGKEESILGIIQHNDKKFVYYYEDIHYIPYTNSSEKIEEFKKLNDWNEELNFDKMSRESLKATIDSVIFPLYDENIQGKTVLTEIAKKFDLDEDQFECLFLDYDGKKTELYFLSFVNEENEEKNYWLICNEDYEINYIEFDPANIDMKALSEFKRSNGWYYGCD